MVKAVKQLTYYTKFKDHGSRIKDQVQVQVQDQRSRIKDQGSSSRITASRRENNSGKD